MKPLAQIEAVTASVKVGKIYMGTVAVKDFAFIEILPGRDGLCHISELSNEYGAAYRTSAVWVTKSRSK